MRHFKRLTCDRASAAITPRISRNLPMPGQNLRQPFLSVTASRQIPNCRLVIKVPDTRENGTRMRHGRRQKIPPVEGLVWPLRSRSLPAWVADPDAGWPGFARRRLADFVARVGGGDMCRFATCSATLWRGRPVQVADGRQCGQITLP